MRDATSYFPFVAAGGLIAASVALGAVAGGTRFAALAALVSALAMVIGAIAFTVWRAPRSATIALDEGGLRVTYRDHAEYVPLATLRGSRVRLGRLELETERGVRAIWLLDGHRPELDAEVEDAIDRARRGPSLPQAGALLARGGQPLDAWLARVREATSGSYRGATLGMEEIEALLAHPLVDVEARAAAAHAVVALGEPSSRARVLQELGPGTPPLVVAAVAMAAGPDAYVAPLEDAKLFLSAADRDVLADALRIRARVDVGAGGPSEEGEGGSPESEGSTQQRRGAQG